LALITQIQWIYIFPITLIYSLSWVLRGKRWKTLLDSTNISITLKEAIYLSFIGNTINLVVPAKIGDFSKLAGLSKVGTDDIKKAAGTIVTDRYFDFIAIVSISLITLPFISVLPKWVNILIAIGSIIGIISTSIFVFLARNRKIGQSLITIVPSRIHKFTINFSEGVINIFNQPSSIILYFYSLLIWSIDNIVAYLVFLSLNTDLLLHEVAIALMIANMTKVIPITPGGIGIFESSFASVLIIFGINADIALVGALLDHLIKNLITLIGGFFGAFIMGISVFNLQSNQVEI
jgi:hypothetical protein